MKVFLEEAMGDLVEMTFMSILVQDKFIQLRARERQPIQ